MSQELVVTCRLQDLLCEFEVMCISKTKSATTEPSAG